MKILAAVLAVVALTGCAGVAQKIERAEHEAVKDAAYAIGDGLEITVDTVQTIRHDLEKVELNVCKKLDKSPHIVCKVQ